MAITPEEWNAIVELIEQHIPAREVTFAKVTKRDDKKKLIWVKEFGQTSIPMVDFDRGFHYYDTVPVGNVVAGQPIATELRKREDATFRNANYKTTLITPKVGQTAIILRPAGVLRFPICIGVIQSRGHWEGE